MANRFQKPGFLSEKQFREHIKLYEGYVKKSESIKNKFEEVSWEDANTTQSSVRNLLLGEIFANNGAKLHEYYFGNLGKSRLNGEIKKALQDFKTMEEFEKRLIAFALSSRGWVILAWDFEMKRLRLFGTDQHDVAVWNTVPLLVLDVYEHAYFIDYGTDRKKYVEDFLTEIDWKVVNDRFKAISN
ncbi:MAG: Fe-Mn family superoxide dismutase [Nanoarchaeota archaeon]